MASPVAPIAQRLAEAGIAPRAPALAEPASATVEQVRGVASKSGIPWMWIGVGVGVLAIALLIYYIYHHGKTEEDM